jgi:hypothetical protein
MTTASELFAMLTAGQTVDLNGTTFQGDTVTNPPPDVTIRNAEFTGDLAILGAQRLALIACTFHPSCRLLGGHGWSLVGCSFHGGAVMAQLNVGLDWNERGPHACPTAWTVSDCRFEPLDGQGGQYPQGHQVYVLTTPNVTMGGRIERCWFSGSPYGATIKIGGTGNDWRREGVRGVTVADCDVAGIVSDAGEVVAVLTQGARTRDVTVTGCTLRGDQGVPPTVASIDGSRVDLADLRTPDGLALLARWYVWLFGLWQRESGTATVGPRRGITLS